jgi:hypothetical protein
MSPYNSAGAYSIESHVRSVRVDYKRVSLKKTFGASHRNTSPSPLSLRQVRGTARILTKTFEIYDNKSFNILCWKTCFPRVSLTLPRCGSKLWLAAHTVFLRKAALNH